MPNRIPRYVSNTDKNLKIGVSNYSEDKVSLEVIGLVGIGSTTPTDILDVQGTTKSKGLNITGVSTFAGAVDLNAGLDVDGQIDADELVVAGVSTFNSRIDLNAGLDIDGHLDEIKIKNSLEELAFHCEDMHVLGVYKAHNFREKK